MQRLQHTGHLTLLRAHSHGGYGPASDFIDAQVVVALDSRPGEAYGLPLLDDQAGPAHRAMFDLLRDAFNAGRTVTLEADMEEGRKNGWIVRVHVVPQKSEPRGGVFTSDNLVFRS